MKLSLVDHRGLVSNSSAKGPVVVFVHGLDSWSGTFRAVAGELARRGIRSVALDLRGHGLSPLGDPEDFGPAQLAADVRAALREAGLLPERVVLLGHSMGGKVALRYAANYPDDLAALVIEDMDCMSKKYAEGVLEISPAELARRRAFDRAFASWEAGRAALISFGYDAARVDGWPKDSPPRVMPHPQGAGIWSAINPYAQWLARRTVLSQRDGYEALQHLAALRGSARPGEALPVHVLVAGPRGTVCSWDGLPGGIRDMESVLPGLVVTSFPQAPHSIHNGALTAFVEAVEGIVASSRETTPARPTAKL